MPRDYKHRVTRRRKRRPVSPWLGMAAGLLIGLFAAAIAYLKLIAPPAPQIAAPAFMPENQEPAAKPAPPKEAKQEEKAPSPSPAKPRFDFYTILPEMEVVIPEEEISAKTAPGTFKPAVKSATAVPESKPVVSPVTTPATGLPRSQANARPAESFRGNYFLQSGSFRAVDQADRLKARLALIGLEASVQKVTINRNTIHRVRVGPFADFSTLDQARALMRQHDIQSTPVMIRR
ncbi:MAG: SPOR domain-containing protein [Gammaproteobacteria bacterium]